MSGVELDWSSAEVRHGRLEVGLNGELPSGWKARFDRTVGLLGGGDWGPIKLKKDRVRVAQVEEGGESRLQHFLESVVLQANAAYEEPDSDSEEDQDEEEDEDESHGPDAEMTQRFRSFAGEPEG